MRHIAIELEAMGRLTGRPHYMVTTTPYGVVAVTAAGVHDIEYAMFAPGAISLLDPAPDRRLCIGCDPDGVAYLNDSRLPTEPDARLARALELLRRAASRLGWVEVDPAELAASN